MSETLNIILGRRNASLNLRPEVGSDENAPQTTNGQLMEILKYIQMGLVNGEPMDKFHLNKK